MADDSTNDLLHTDAKAGAERCTVWGQQRFAAVIFAGLVALEFSAVWYCGRRPSEQQR
jgi:hypothetical protein